MNLGNLFDEAGFEVVESKAYHHQWFPKVVHVGRSLGRGFFDFLCTIYDRLRRDSSQVRVITKK